MAHRHEAISLLESDAMERLVSKSNQDFVFAIVSETAGSKSCSTALKYS